MCFFPPPQKGVWNCYSGLKCGIKRCLGDGRSIRFRFDFWVVNSSLDVAFPSRFGIDLDQSAPVSSGYMSCEWARDWMIHL